MKKRFGVAACMFAANGRYILPHHWAKIKNGKGKIIFIMTTTVLTRYVRVANLLHDKNDLQLLDAGRTYVSEVNSDPLFATPEPSLASSTTMLNDFEALITAANGGTHTAIDARNAKREELMAQLTTFGNYVERIANDPANVALGPVFVIQSAGMRPAEQATPHSQIFRARQGKLHGEIMVTAASVNGDGTHQWRWKMASSPDGWSEIVNTSAAKYTFTGLERGALIEIGHRVVASQHHTIDWETTDPIVVP